MKKFSSENCQWGSWSSWSSCSKTCGVGSSSRNRSIVRYAKNGGRSCGGSSTATKSCYKLRSCPEKVIVTNCEWSTWGSWSSCSKTCGDGSSQRRRTVAKYAQNGGNKCVGSHLATKTCITKSCPGMIVNLGAIHSSYTSMYFIHNLVKHLTSLPSNLSKLKKILMPKL